MTEPKIPPRPTGPHPTADQLFLAVAAERSGECRPADEEVFAHAATCAECSAEIAHLEAFAQPEPVAPAALASAWERFRDGAGTAAKSVEATAPPRQATIVPFPVPSIRPRPAATGGSSPWRYAGWAAAATLTLGLGLGFFLGTTSVQTIRPPAGTPSGAAVPPAADGLRGGVLSGGPMAPTGSLDQAPAEIRFANPDREPKRVLLFATEPPYQWQSPETTGDRVELPATERAKLQPGVDYFWSVLDAEGESAARTFRLEGRTGR